MNRVATVLVMVLIMNGCVTVREDDRVAGYMSLYYAAMHRNEDLVRILLVQGAPVDLPAPDGPLWQGLGAQAENMESPLQAAARSGSTEIVRMLLEHKPWIDHRCCDGSTALCIAQKAGYTEIVSLLKNAGANPRLCKAATSMSPNQGFHASSRNLLAQVMRRA